MRKIAQVENSHSTKQRKYYKSIMESRYTTDEAKQTARKLLNADEYVPDSNTKQLETADAIISNSSVDSQLDSLMSKSIYGGNIKAIDVAIGERLIQYYSKTGNATKLRDAIQATLYGLNATPSTTVKKTIVNYIVSMEGKTNTEKNEMLKAFSWIIWYKDGSFSVK